MTLRLVPVTKADADAFVAAHHRHNLPPKVTILQVAVAGEDGICGVAQAARPVSPKLCDGWTIEAVRVCTDGTPNACSILYGAIWRAARALGYRRLVTYTTEGEDGGSLRAAGLVPVFQGRPRSWDQAHRPRRNDHEVAQRTRWELRCEQMPDEEPPRVSQTLLEEQSSLDL